MPLVGLEPTMLLASDFESDEYTNSSTRAHDINIHHRMIYVKCYFENFLRCIASNPLRILAAPAGFAECT